MTFSTMLEIYLDPVKRAEFEEAVKEALKLMGVREENHENFWAFFWTPFACALENKEHRGV